MGLAIFTFMLMKTGQLAGSLWDRMKVATFLESNYITPHALRVVIITCLILSCFPTGK
jgi:hypothetical protein